MGNSGLEVQGRVELPDGKIAADAVGTYVFLGQERLARMTAGYPGLAKGWMVS